MLKNRIKHRRDKISVSFKPEGQGAEFYIYLGDLTIEGADTVNQCKAQWLGMKDLKGRSVMEQVPPPEMWVVTCKQKTGVNQLAGEVEYSAELTLEPESQIGACPEFRDGSYITVTFMKPVDNLYANPDDIGVMGGSV